jgi:hypothetical protein
MPRADYWLLAGTAESELEYAGRWRRGGSTRGRPPLPLSQHVYSTSPSLKEKCPWQLKGTNSDDTVDTKPLITILYAEDYLNNIKIDYSQLPENTFLFCHVNYS